MSCGACVTLQNIQAPTDTPVCTLRPAADSAGSASADLTNATLDVKGMSSMFLVGPGTVLVFSNLNLKGFAKLTDYQYSPGSPYRLLGTGLGIWPTVDLAPNGTVSSRLLCVNPWYHSSICWQSRWSCYARRRWCGAISCMCYQLPILGKSARLQVGE